MTDVTNEGEQLIKAWTRADDAVATAKRTLNSAECDASNARNALGKWLMPHDAKTGEKFSVWHLDSLIEVTVTNGDPELRIRTRGKQPL